MKNPLKLVVGSHTGGIDPFSSFGFEVNPAVRWPSFPKKGFVAVIVTFGLVSL